MRERGGSEGLAGIFVYSPQGQIQRFIKNTGKGWINDAIPSSDNGFYGISAYLGAEYGDRLELSSISRYNSAGNVTKKYGWNWAHGEAGVLWQGGDRGRIAFAPSGRVAYALEGDQENGTYLVRIDL